MPRDQDLFTPFILAIQPNTIVTWQNDDTISHTIMTTWDQSNFLNPQAFSLTAAAGQTVSFTFTRPGIYDYFDHAKARWVDADRRVKADKSVPHFPLAMEGSSGCRALFVVCRLQRPTSFPREKDDFMTNFIAITAGGTVSWHNSDTDEHFVDLVYGWSGPINPTGDWTRSDQGDTGDSACW